MSTRFQDPPSLLEDLNELGMAGELSNSNQHITMAFEDVHLLVTIMRMAEAILNERVQNGQKAKIDCIKSQLDAERCLNMSALLVELEKPKQCISDAKALLSFDWSF
jgi:hypothetical protein